MTAAPVPGKPAPQKRPAPAALPQKQPAASGGQTAVVTYALLKKSIVIQTWIIAALAAVFVVLLPFSKPVPLYYAISPDKKVRALSATSMPNMTDRSILSWSTTSITEVMTMGFGDIAIRMPKQRVKFTKRGWDAFTKSFEAMKIEEAFKQSQLVLTTVPSNTPVIVAQGVNPDNIYQWVVQMPVIMNYATNNNVMRKQNSTVTLTIVRVPIEESAAGIAIQNWRID
ncbi:MAG: DotI/IcmL/TraM family protein [Bdellovibrionales bacterium]